MVLLIFHQIRCSFCLVFDDIKKLYHGRIIVFLFTGTVVIKNIYWLQSFLDIYFKQFYLVSLLFLTGVDRFNPLLWNMSLEEASEKPVYLGIYACCLEVSYIFSSFFRRLTKRQGYKSKRLDMAMSVFTSLFFRSYFFQ